MKKPYIHTFVAGILLLFPIVAFGATISVDSSTQTFSVGDTRVLQVALDTENQTINAIDGEISLSGALDAYVIKEISIASSKFSLWPRTPSLSLDKKTVSFVGGIPKGVKSDSVVVFEIVIEAVKAGQIVLTPQNTSVLLSDGKGTSASVGYEASKITVVSRDSGVNLVDEWSDKVLDDTNPPKSFSAESGNDSALFGGKTFIAFTTTDSESGINYYEVTEGALPTVRSGSPYVLQNQGVEEVVTISAYDKAGNKTVSKFNTKEKSSFPLVLIVAVIILTILAVWFFRKRKNNPNVI